MVVWKEKAKKNFFSYIDLDTIIGFLGKLDMTSKAQS